MRLTLGGVGGAFGGREDLSMQIHACMLALRTGRPVKMVYSREESFFGHVHRHPCRMRYEHGATRDGRLVFVRARIVLDGGAYASSSTAVCSNAACFAAGPYAVPNAELTAYVAYTNNPPCGAMRGFGAVQVAFAHEAQMDKLAAALGMDPVELRLRNAIAPGDRLPTGQVVPEPAPVAELLERVRGHAAAAAGDGRPTRASCRAASPTPRTARASGAASATPSGSRTSASRRGSTTTRPPACASPSTPTGRSSRSTPPRPRSARACRPCRPRSRAPSWASSASSCCAPTPAVGSAGSTSASRQTYVTGGAVKAACEAVRDQLVALGARPGDDDALAATLAERPVEATVEWHHRQTFPLDERGQGDAHLQFAFSAHRAVVDVDCELGLVRVVELATAQEVGRAINPQALEGQIEGGSAQGLGLALMEEIQVRDGEVLNASFTDYLIPTTLDMPRVRIEVLEHADPTAPYGLKGVGEPPNISTPPAVVAAVRAATGRPLARIPVRPEHIV